MLLKDYVPFFIYKIKEMQNIYNVQQKELDKLNIDIEDLVTQCFIKTATWGLKYWEEFLNINTDKSKSIEERRSNILAKIRGQGTTTAEIIKEIAQAYADKAEVTEDNPNYAFYINLESFKGYPFNLESLYNNINEIKPAHLECKYKLTSMTRDKLLIGACTLGGEEIVVYPWSPKAIECKGKINIALGHNTGFEDITIYPKGAI